MKNGHALGSRQKNFEKLLQKPTWRVKKHRCLTKSLNQDPLCFEWSRGLFTEVANKKTCHHGALKKWLPSAMAQNGTVLMEGTLMLGAQWRYWRSRLRTSWISLEDFKNSIMPRHLKTPFRPAISSLLPRLVHPSNHRQRRRSARATAEMWTFCQLSPSQLQRCWRLDKEGPSGWCF